MFLTLHLSFHQVLTCKLSCLDYFHFATYYNSFSPEICQWNSLQLNISVPDILYRAFIWISFLLVDFVRSLLANFASSQRNIIDMKFIINASNNLYWLWAGLSCLHINSLVYVFVPYISTHLSTYLLLMYQLICFFAHIH